MKRIRHQLFRNVLPTLLIFLLVGWLSMILAEQIYLAKKNQRPALADMPRF